MAKKLEYQEENGKVYCPLRGKWLVATPEEKVRQRYICVLVNEYGYKPDQMRQEVSVANSSRGTGRASADIVIWKSKEDACSQKPAFIVVECKADNVRIRQEDYYQGANYASWAKADFFVTMNGVEYKYFRVDPDSMPSSLVEVVGIPSAEDLEDAKRIEAIKNKTKTFTREEFTNTLKACHDIIRNNDKLSPEAAFDEISKLLFMKIRYERESKGMKVFTKAEYMSQADNYEQNIRPDLKVSGVDRGYMQHMFGTTKVKFKDDHLFDDHDEIKIRENSFIQILEKLENFNLSDTQDDVKGIAFEQFLGTTFRGELGQFFTPRTVVDFMTEVLDPQEGETICDPTCGSGGFLIKAFEYVREHIEADVVLEKERLRKEIEGPDYDTLPESKRIEADKEVDRLYNALNRELDANVTDSRVYNLSHSCIYGTDANPRMARTSKMNMIMHGDGHGGVHHHDGLLNVNGIFEERFDVILTNPPFGQSVGRGQLIAEADRFKDEAMKAEYRKRYGADYDNALSQVDDHIGEPLLSLYDTGSMSALTEVLFMERCLRLLKKGGRMGMVLPEGVLNNKKLAAVREYFEGRAKLVLICSLPQDVFIAAGATVKPSLVFMKRFTEEEEAEYAECRREAMAVATARHQADIDALSKKVRRVEKTIAALKEEAASARKELRAAKKQQKPVAAPEGAIKDIQGKQKVAKGEKKAAEKELASLQKIIEQEAKQLVKEKFDYLIPIAKVEDAGITSTGAPSDDNQLPALAKEYRSYRLDNDLWDDDSIKYTYTFEDDGCHRRSAEGDVTLG